MKKLLFFLLPALLLAGCKPGEENTPEPAGLSIEPQLITCPDAGGDYTIELTSPNGSWSATSNESWIRVTPTSGEKGTTEVRIKISPNKESAETKGVITFTSGEEKVEMPVSRAAKAAPYLRVVSEKALNTPKEGGTYTVQVESNIKWSASSNTGWAKVNKGVSVNNDNITVTVNPATTPEETTATITIAPYGEGEAAGKQEVIITRGSTEATSLSVDPTEITAPENGGSFTVNVSSNAKWRVYKTWDMDWLTLSGSQDGDGNGSFSFSIEEATSMDAVSGILTIEEDRSDNYKPVVTQVAVSRKGKAAADLTVAPIAINAPAEGGHFPVAVKSNYPWTATTSGNFFSLSSTSGDGYSTIVVSVNPATNERENTGFIIIRTSFGNEQARINIKRAGKELPALAFDPMDNPKNVTYNGGDTNVRLLSNVSWTVHSTDTNLVKVTPSSGSGQAILNLTVSPAIDTRQETAYIIASTTDGSNITAKLTVNRAGLPQTVPPYQVGEFTVNSEGKKVRFAPGNLQFNPYMYPGFRFALYQFQYVGGNYNGKPYGNVYIIETGEKCSNENISMDYYGWVDLFCWGTGNNPADKDVEEEEFHDWGDNQIRNFDRIDNAGTWRTLTKDEWDYLLHKRAGYNTSYSHATVNTVQGHILLPDNFVIPSDIHFEPVAINFTTNVYDFDQWQKMEKAGAVFLPAGGRRSGTSYIPYYFDNANKKMLIGTYWSSTLCPAGWYGHPEGAYYIFYSSYGYAINDGYRSNGFSVRLVKDAN